MAFFSFCRPSRGPTSTIRTWSEVNRASVAKRRAGWRGIARRAGSSRSEVRSCCILSGQLPRRRRNESSSIQEWMRGDEAGDSCSMAEECGEANRLSADRGDNPHLACWIPSMRYNIFFSGYKAATTHIDHCLIQSSQSIILFSDNSRHGGHTIRGPASQSHSPTQEKICRTTDGRCSGAGSDRASISFQRW